MVTTSLKSTRPGTTRCPRCSGRLSATRDHHGAYLSCFTCGYTYEKLLGSALTAPDDTLATVPAGHTAGRTGADHAPRDPTGWSYVSTPGTAVTARPYAAAPARRCERCQLRMWAWSADGPVRGAWRCSYCDGSR